MDRHGDKFYLSCGGACKFDEQATFIATIATTPTIETTAATAPLQPHACAFDFSNQPSDFQNEVWTVRVAHATSA